jgi:hypothetical protein
VREECKRLADEYADKFAQQAPPMSNAMAAATARNDLHAAIDRLAAVALHPAPSEPPAFTHSPQKGIPGHCYCAQVWGPDGRSVATLDSTDDPAVASQRAAIIAAALSATPQVHPAPLTLDEVRQVLRCSECNGRGNTGPVGACKVCGGFGSVFKEPMPQVHPEESDDDFAARIEASNADWKPAQAHPAQTAPAEPTDEQIAAIWKAWPHQAITSAAKAISFVRAVQGRSGSLPSGGAPAAREADGRSLPHGWISVDESMPEHQQSVALVNVNRWENVGGDWLRNVHACGYWDNWAGGHWSVRGERAMTLESFTHWMPLPAAPTGVPQDSEPTRSDE